MGNSLSQYIEFYRANRELIESNSAEAFNRLREEACRNLEIEGLPRKGSENYEITDLQEMLAPDFGINIARIPMTVNVAESFRCGLPHLTSSIFFFLNDLWGEGKGARNNLPQGIEIMPLSKALECDPEAKEKYGTLADAANPLVALNNMLVQEGIFIRVRKDVKVEKPLQLVGILEGLRPLMAFRRILIILEEGARISLLNCEHTASKNLPMATSTVAEVFAGVHSRIDFYDMEESGNDTRRLSSFYLSQEERSKVRVESFCLHNGKTRNEYYCRFSGPDSSLKLYGLGIEGGRNVLDNYSEIRHCSTACHTEELFKYIVDEEAQGAFTGRIYVAPGAVKTEAYQSNRNLVGSDKARIYSKPQLEIYNDDVKCSHGSATGQLDAMQLFYLRSRGLSDDMARLLLKQAFMADIIAGVKLPILRDRLQNLVERRLSGQDLSCGECDICHTAE